jgi:hypothetical protein
MLVSVAICVPSVVICGNFSGMFDTGTPATGAEFRSALSTLLGEGMTYQSPRSDAWFFAPQGSAWSPAVHYRHLRKSSSALLKGVRLPRLMLQLRFGRHRGPSRSFTELRQVYLDMIAAGAKAKGGFVPSEEPSPPDPSGRRQEILTRWTSVTIELTNAIAEWDEASLDRLQVPHPLLGDLSMREMMAFTVFHTAHHLQRVAERSEPLGG